MIYVKSILGGLAALLSSVAVVRWISKPTAKDGMIGNIGLPLFAPRVLFLEVLIFMVGFLIIWLLVRQKYYA